MATTLRNIDLQDVLPYMPNPVDGESLENLHRDLVLELDKISFLTEVLRDKIDIVDENIATVDAKGDSDEAKKVKEEVEKALKELAKLEQTVSAQANDLSQSISKVEGDIAAETIARSKAISDEIVARGKALLDEASARTAAILAETNARTVAILKEQKDRLLGLEKEAKARAAAITKEQGDRAAAIAVERSERVTEDAAITSSITTLTTVVNGNIADIKSEVKTRSDNDAAMGSRLDSIVASIGSVTGELDNYSFDKGKKNWSISPEGQSSPENAPGTIITVPNIGNALQLTGTHTIYYGRAIPIQTNRTYRVRIRVFQNTDDTDITLQKLSVGVACLDVNYQELGDRFAAAHDKVIKKADGWVYYEGLMTGTSSTVDHNKFATQTTFAKPMFIVNGGGGLGITDVDLLEFIDITDRQVVLAAVQNEATARANKDIALTKQINTLTSEVSKNTNSVSAVASRVTKTETDISGKASVSDVNVLSNKVNTNIGNINNLVSRVATAETDITGKASVSSVNTLQSKVSSNTNSITKAKVDIDATAVDVVKLKTDVAGKASISSVATLKSNVTSQGSSITALNSKVSKVETSLTGKASTSDVNALRTSVDQNKAELATERSSRASNDAALGKRVDSVVATVESINDQVVNFDFESNKQNWSTIVTGANSPDNLGGTIVKVAGEGKVLQTENMASGYYANAIPVDTSRKYKMRVKVRQTVNPTNGTKAGFYAGVATLDSNYNNQTGGAGTHRYFTYSGGQLTTSHGWYVFEGVITAEGASHTNFRPGTAYVKPMFITNYSGGNGTAQIAYIKFWDATEEIDNKAAVTTEQKARADGDKSLGSRIDTISTQVRNKVDNSVVSGLATRVTNVETLASGKASASSVSSLQTKVNQNAANITSEIKARSDRDKSLTSSITGLSSKVDGKASNSTVSALTRRVTTAEANINGKASVSSVNTLQTKVNQNTASVQTAANSVNGLKAQYTIKTEATTGGSRVIAGIGLLADAKANISEVAITADNFFVIPATRKTNFNPSTDKQFSPFLVSGNKTYLQNAFIRNAAIDTAKIKDLSVVTAKIANFAIDSTKIRDASITNAKIANVIQSNDYIAGKRGWKIDKAGAVEFGSGKFRGDISGATGTFSGNLSGAKGTFSGDISGASGHFSGAVSAGKIVGAVGITTKSGRFAAGQYIWSNFQNVFARDAVVTTLKIKREPFDREVYVTASYGDLFINTNYGYNPTEYFKVASGFLDLTNISAVSKTNYSSKIAIYGRSRSYPLTLGYNRTLKQTGLLLESPLIWSITLEASAEGDNTIDSIPLTARFFKASGVNNLLQFSVGAGSVSISASLYKKVAQNDFNLV